MVKEVVRGQATKNLDKMAKELLPGGVLHLSRLPDEIFTGFTRGKGSRIWDVDGNEYIDYLIGAGPLILGHAHPAVVEAVKQRVEMGTQFYQITDDILQLSKEIVGAIPCAESIKYTNSGNEATLLALRLARAYTGKPKMMKFEGGYHGTHEYTAWSTRASGTVDFPKGEPDGDGMPDALADQVLIAPFNDADYATSLIRQHKDDLAAVILPTMANNFRPKPGFLEALRDATKECNVLLIFDEVVTGFRLAWGGAMEYYGVIPDLATHGKIPGGGFPIGTVVGPKEIMNRMDPAMKSEGKYVMTSGTFSGNPITAVAGMATLKELQKPGIYERLWRSGQRLQEGLKQVCDVLETPAQVQATGPVVDVYFTDQEVFDHRSSLKSDAQKSRALGIGMTKRGIFTPNGGHFYISLAHTDEDLDETVNVFETAMREIS